MTLPAVRRWPTRGEAMFGPAGAVYRIYELHWMLKV
jgi:hypothetical protein